MKRLLYFQSASSADSHANICTEQAEQEHLGQSNLKHFPGGAQESKGHNQCGFSSKFNSTCENTVNNIVTQN